MCSDEESVFDEDVRVMFAKSGFASRGLDLA